MAIENGRDHVCDNYSKEQDFFWHPANWQSSPGNYLGAIRNWVALQDDFESIYCVVDLHAITVPQDPVQLRQSTREVTASLIAAGISPERSILFNQSCVPQHAQLAWIFNCVARLGWLNRMTQFKEKAGKIVRMPPLVSSYPTLWLLTSRLQGNACAGWGRSETAS